MYLITVLNWRGELKLKKYFVKEIEGPISLWVRGIWLTMKTKRVQCETVVDMLGQGIDYRGEMWKNTIWP